MVHRRPIGQLVGQAGELRRRLPRAHGVASLGAQVAERHDPPPVGEGEAGGRVDRLEAEEEDVAGAELPLADVVERAVGLES